MNFGFFIAKRYLGAGKSGFSGPIVRIAVFSIALGLAAMIISISVVSGFQNAIRDKITGFGAHIHITSYDVSQSYERPPLSIHQSFYPIPDTVKGIRHIQVFGTKAGIIRTEEMVEGIILKGIGKDFDWSFFEDKITEGAPINVRDTLVSGDVMISRITARRLTLKTGDPLRVYFIQNETVVPRGRKFTISGIYDTGLEDFDKLYIIGDIRHIRRLNQWDNDEVGGFEVFAEDFGDLDRAGDIMHELAGPELDVTTIVEQYPQIFEWLNLHHMNAAVIIVLMLIISGITMISTLLVLILERSSLIGVLKALGARNSRIRNIMMLKSAYIIGQGLVFGNITGLALCILQIKTGLLRLDQESYYVSYVPVHLDVQSLLAINVLTFGFCTLLLILPSYVVTRIAPIKVIRFG